MTERSQNFSSITKLSDEWAARGGRSPEELIDFVLQANLSDDERRMLAYRTIGDEFERRLSSAAPPSIESRITLYFDAFKAREFPLDRRELTRLGAQDP